MFLVLSSQISQSTIQGFTQNDRTTELKRDTPVKRDKFEPIRRDNSERVRGDIQVSIRLFTNRQSHMGFRSVPKSVTFSDLELPSGRHHALFHTKRQLSEPAASTALHCTAARPEKVYSFFVIYGLRATTRAISTVAELLADFGVGVAMMPHLRILLA